MLGVSTEKTQTKRKIGQNKKCIQVFKYSQMFYQRIKVCIKQLYNKKILMLFKQLGISQKLFDQKRQNCFRRMFVFSNLYGSFNFYNSFFFPLSLFFSVLSHYLSYFSSLFYVSLFSSIYLLVLLPYLPFLRIYFFEFHNNLALFLTSAKFKQSHIIVFPIIIYNSNPLISYNKLGQQSMKRLTFISLTAFLLILHSWASLVSLSSINTQPLPNKPSDIQLDLETKMQFENFKRVNGKGYQSDNESLRLKIFRQNVKRIKERNKKNSDYTQQANFFSDLTQQQFVSTYLMKIKGNIPQPSSNNVIVSLDGVGVGATLGSVDWTNKSAPVVNQGGCGSCWAFSAVGTIQINERIRNRSASSTKNYAEQQVVDCCKGGSYGSQGCNGGWPTEALSYITKVKGIALQSIYPYKGSDNACRDSAVRKNNIINGYLSYSGTPSTINVLQKGSASVLVDATNWSTYRAGNFSCTPSISLNHAVVLVGYDAKKNWKIRNSWGNKWGMSGYMWLKSGSQCGLTRSVVIPRFI